MRLMPRRNIGSPTIPQRFFREEGPATVAPGGFVMSTDPRPSGESQLDSAAVSRGQKAESPTGAGSRLENIRVRTYSLTTLSPPGATDIWEIADSDLRESTRQRTEGRPTGAHRGFTVAPARDCRSCGARNRSSPTSTTGCGRGSVGLPVAPRLGAACLLASHGGYFAPPFGCCALSARCSLSAESSS